jgi:hypothetical protein
LPRKRTRTRRRSLLGLAALLFAAGCGGGGESAPPPPRAAIPRAVADRLAATSDSIADSIDQGDVCRAAGLADDLKAQVSAAIDAGKVPRRFQSQLRARATELVNTVNCPPPVQTTTDVDEDKSDENGNGKKKDKKKEKKQTETQTETQPETQTDTQTEPTVTVEIPTTEEQP